MKKLLPAILATVIAITAMAVPVSAFSDKSAANTVKTEDIFIRDPFVLPADGKYYMYGTGCADNGYGCYVSADLENWEGPYKVFDFGSDFDGCNWAPECHFYEGNYYLFATYKSKKTGFRGVSVFRASSPLGPFTEISDGHITPHTRDCIDGTLYVDENGQPWMVYVNEWTSEPDGIGKMAAAKLSDDLSHFISEPRVLFKANDALWADGNITDGPFLYKTRLGSLIMLWSNGCKTGYAVGLAYSAGEGVDSSWYHSASTLYRKDSEHPYDGGHGMLFETTDGRLMMAIHSPNSSQNGEHEHAVFYEVEDTGHTLILKREYPTEGIDYFVFKLNRFRDLFVGIFNKLMSFFA